MCMIMSQEIQEWVVSGFNRGLFCLKKPWPVLNRSQTFFTLEQPFVDRRKPEWFCDDRKSQVADFLFLLLGNVGAHDRLVELWEPASFLVLVDQNLHFLVIRKSRVDNHRLRVWFFCWACTLFKLIKWTTVLTCKASDLMSFPFQVKAEQRKQWGLIFENKNSHDGFSFTVVVSLGKETNIQWNFKSTICTAGRCPCLFDFLGIRNLLLKRL